MKTLIDLALVDQVPPQVDDQARLLDVDGTNVFAGPARAARPQLLGADDGAVKAGQFAVGAAGSAEQPRVQGLHQVARRERKAGVESGALLLTLPAPRARLHLEQLPPGEILQRADARLDGHGKPAGRGVAAEKDVQRRGEDVERLGEGDGQDEGEGQDRVQPPDAPVQGADRLQLQRRQGLRQRVAHGGPRCGGEDGAAGGDPPQLSLLSLGTEVAKAFPHAELLDHPLLGLGPGRGSQPAFNVQALGHPQSAEEKSADGDQQQTCQEGITVPEADARAHFLEPPRAKHVAADKGCADAHDQDDAEKVQHQLEELVEQAAKDLHVERQIEEVLIDGGQRRAHEQDDHRPENGLVRQQGEGVPCQPPLIDAVGHEPGKAAGRHGAEQLPQEAGPTRPSGLRPAERPLPHPPNQGGQEGDDQQGDHRIEGDLRPMRDVPHDRSGELRRLHRFIPSWPGPSRSKPAAVPGRRPRRRIGERRKWGPWGRC